MKNKNSSIKKEPLIHITKRDSLSPVKTLSIRVIAILLGFIFSSLVVVILAKKNPFSVIGSIFKGNFGSERKIWNLLNETFILCGLSLAVTPAFKMKFWNCGAEGQALVGALACAGSMFFFGEKLPLPVLFLVMIVTSILSSAIWALIPALFKAFFGTNETLFTLMMNYIAIQLVNYCLKVWVKTGSGTLPGMYEYHFPELIKKHPQALTILIVFVLCALMFIYFKYSKQGYEIAVVGESQKTAKYVGINVKKVIIRTMLISGAICGVMGLLLVGNGSCTITKDIVGGRGFTAILISWLANFNPFFMILASGLVAFLNRGYRQVSTDLRIPTATGEIVTAILLLFVIGSEFFINYKLNFKKFNFKKKNKEVIEK